MIELRTLNNKLLVLFLMSQRKIYRSLSRKQEDDYISDFDNKLDYINQDANDLIKNLIISEEPFMISKFGTVELSALINFLSMQQKKFSFNDYWEYISSKRHYLWWISTLDALCNNAGFFPNNKLYFKDFCDIYFESIRNIDVLGSYLKDEQNLSGILQPTTRINLDGFYAPFYFNDPWTKALKGKRVLVIHPFEESIKKQYKIKDLVWGNANILPDFELITLKAVQSIAGEKTAYKDWFEALDYMKSVIINIDFDIALIGCGAYGMPLASYVKTLGKQSIHLAGWTQVIFGIIGTRWINNPKVSAYMNEYWIRPQKNEIVKNGHLIENSCYW